MDIIFFKIASDSGIISNLISGLGGVIIGALITFGLEQYSEHKEIKTIALNSAHYIFVLLYQERASLQGIKDLIDQSQNGIARKIFLKPLFLNINQESIEKLLAYQKCYKYDYANIIQALTVSEQCYRNCFELVNLYNQIVHKYLEQKASSPSDDSELLKGYRIEINSDIDSLKAKYDEAMALNKQADELFNRFCSNVFGSFESPVTQGVAKAIDISQIKEKK